MDGRDGTAFGIGEQDRNAVGGAHGGGETGGLPVRANDAIRGEWLPFRGLGSGDDPVAVYLLQQEGALPGETGRTAEPTAPGIEPCVGVIVRTEIEISVAWTDSSRKSMAHAPRGGKRLADNPRESAGTLETPAAGSGTVRIHDGYDFSALTRSLI